MQGYLSNQEPRNTAKSPLLRRNGECGCLRMGTEIAAGWTKGWACVASWWKSTVWMEVMGVGISKSQVWGQAWSRKLVNQEPPMFLIHVFLQPYPTSVIITKANVTSSLKTTQRFHYHHCCIFSVSMFPTSIKLA